jgi:FKBP-type peptidyl-prolyl cis-trans isomerase FkpA
MLRVWSRIWGVALALLGAASAAFGAPLGPPTGFPPGLQVVDTLVGDGPAVGRGDIVAVHYAGYLYDPAAQDGHGKPFDSTAEHGGDPLVFRLGRNSVIAGWEAGITGMQRGGRRHLVIPPQLAYGSRSVGRKVPANATLVFEVTLVSLQVMD